MQHGLRLLIGMSMLALLTGCEVLEALQPDWLRGANRVIKRAPGERVDVLANSSRILPDESAKDETITIPDQTNLTRWHNHNDAMRIQHPGLTGITTSKRARVGEGHAFSRATGPSPIVDGGLVIAMDAAGYISAHSESDITRIVWNNSDGLPEDVSDLLGGGLASDGEFVYATTGDGLVRAITLKEGKTVWKTRVGAPVRGAPAAGSGLVAVITADNQTIALNSSDGATRWSHRGIREVAGYASNVAPIISDGMVTSAYSSGELFAIRAESGSVIWNDTLGGTVKTRASAVFSSIDADPVVQEGVVVAISAAGEMQASALINGRPLWSKRIGGHSTPWSAGNAMFVLADTHDVAAIMKPTGAVRWSSSLAEFDKRDTTRDVTPALYGPVLAGNAVLVLDANGNLTAFKPQDGTRLNSYELAPGAITAPVIANGALYYLTKDARLYRYY